MPVIVETLAQPSAQDRLDLAKIYADAPDWLFAPHADGAALVAAGLAAGELIAGRFNDRLLGAALLRRGDDAWQLSHLACAASPAAAGSADASSTRPGAWLPKPASRCAWSPRTGTWRPVPSRHATGCRWTASDMLGGGPRHGLRHVLFLRRTRRPACPQGGGPTVLQRLEQMGLDSFVRLRDCDAASILAQGAALTGSSCWKNSPQARAAIVAVLQRAASDA